MVIGQTVANIEIILYRFADTWNHASTLIAPAANIGDKIYLSVAWFNNAPFGVTGYIGLSVWTPDGRFIPISTKYSSVGSNEYGRADFEPISLDQPGNWDAGIELVVNQSQLQFIRIKLAAVSGEEVPPTKKPFPALLVAGIVGAMLILRKRR